jgi:uncharacterized Zn finger protein (UPF0148 family)
MPKAKLSSQPCLRRRRHIVDDTGRNYDLEALKKTIMTLPEKFKLLHKNEKIRHSDGTSKQFYNVGLPALKGLVVNEKTNEFVIVDTCPGAGICKTYCYAMNGNYVRFPSPSMRLSRILNLLLNHPHKFAGILKSEINTLRLYAEEGTKVCIRWHDAGDFFSPQYMNMAFDVARSLPDVDFYAYTKIAAVIKAKKPSNFIVNFSVDALPSEEKQLDLTKIKKIEVVPQKMFWKYIVTKGSHPVKDEKERYQFRDRKALEEFKDKLVEMYQVRRDSLLMYEDYVEMKYNGKLGNKPNIWNVIVPPGKGVGDEAATDPLVRVSLLMQPTIIEVDEGVITCPTCGKTIVEEDGPVSQPSCDHVRFIYVNGDAFEYIDPDLQKELNAEEAAAEERDEEFDTWDALRAHTGSDSIVLEQAQRGMACGPMSFTVWVGIRKSAAISGGRKNSFNSRKHRRRDS